MKIIRNDKLETSKNTKIFKIDKDYKQIWIAWIRPTWPVPERARSTIYRRRLNTSKTHENHQKLLFRDLQKHKKWRKFNSV